MGADARRGAPGTVWSAATLLVLVAVAALLLGLAVTWVSGVDGVTSPVPALLGAGTAAACAAAAGGAMARRMRRWAVLALGAVPVVVCVAASPGSVDVAALVLPAGLLWLVLLVLLTRRSARAWLPG